MVKQPMRNNRSGVLSAVRYGAILFGFVLVLLSGGSLRSQTITSVSPNVIKLGSGETDVKVYGTGFAQNQPISIACHGATSYPSTSAGGKTYVTVPIQRTSC
jgi:hypothetical protein